MTARSAIEGVEVGATYEYRATRIADLLSKIGVRNDSIDTYLAGDLYYTFYLPFPRLVADPSGLEERWVLLAEILASAKTWKIKSHTVADPQLSTVAAALLIRNLASETGNSPGRGNSSETASGGRGKSAVSRALGKTLEEVRNAAAAKSIMEKLGAGSSSSLQFEDTLDIMLELARRTDVREIEKILSGIRVAVVSSPGATVSPKGWIEGVELGGDLERVHPSRLALPWELFLAEIANSRLLLYQKKMYSDQGDVYVLLDKSGSMSGEKINWARAVALALLAKARASRRRFRLRYFDSIVYELVEVSGRVKPRVLADAVRRIATVKAGGGTNITGALARAVEDSEQVRGRVDIVLITDGEDKLSQHIIKSIISRPAVRLHTVMIKGSNPTLEKVSHTYMVAKRLDEGEGLRVVRRTFSPF